MILILVLVFVGIAIGLIIPFQLYVVSSFYISVGILAAIDSIVGALKASYDEEFDMAIFVSGLVINTLMAVALSWIGDKIGIPLYYAAVFVFGTRLFNNLALVRRRLIEQIRKKRMLYLEKKEEAERMRRLQHMAEAEAESPADSPLEDVPENQLKLF